MLEPDITGAAVADVAGEASREASAATINLNEIKEWAGREAQKRVILELQKRTNISRQELARILGVDPKTLRSRLKEISTDPRAPDSGPVQVTRADRLFSS